MILHRVPSKTRVDKYWKMNLNFTKRKHWPTQETSITRLIKKTVKLHCIMIQSVKNQLKTVKNLVSIPSTKYRPKLKKKFEIPQEQCREI